MSKRRFPAGRLDSKAATWRNCHSHRARSALPLTFRAASLVSATGIKRSLFAGWQVKLALSIRPPIVSRGWVTRPSRSPFALIPPVIVGAPSRRDGATKRSAYTNASTTRRTKRIGPMFRAGIGRRWWGRPAADGGPWLWLNDNRLYLSTIWQ